MKLGLSGLGLGRRVGFTEKGLGFGCDVCCSACGFFGGIKITAVEKDQMVIAKTL